MSSRPVVVTRITTTLQAVLLLAVCAVAAPALFLVGSTRLVAGDVAIRNRLQSLGFEVTVVDDDASTTAHASGKALVVVSSTCTSSKIAAKYRDIAVPVIVNENALLDDMKMTGATANVSFGTVSKQTQVVIRDATHPLAAGRSGTVTLSNSQTYNWGVPSSAAARIASLTSSTTKMAVFGYEQGSSMVGMNAPSRRVSTFLTDATATGLTTNGWALFDAAVNWATGPVANTAPVVNAGTDLTITLPSAASLSATVTDDGLPVGSTLARSWSRISGPGTVTFGDIWATSTSATFSIAGTYVLRMTASDGELSAYDELTVTVNPVTNQPPAVNAGADQTVVLPSTATLGGTASDDGLPEGSTVSVSWSQTSGPGTVTIGNASALSTTAAFPVAGTYVLRLTATDGDKSAYDELTVTVSPVPNQAPVVDAGVNQIITLPSTAALSGSASDDGLPEGSALSVTWSQTSGPGTVTFADASLLSTTAAFSVAGTYVLRLTATDSDKSAYDELTVTVNAAPNQEPAVDAGVDQIITLPSTATLSGSASDDGLPAGSTLSVTWSQTSGPGTVTFANASALSTTAALAVAGDYVLRLTASDGDLSVYDELSVTVRPEPNQPPVARFTATPLRGSAPLTVAFDASESTDPNTGDQLSFTWDFGDGTIGSGVAVSHTYTAPDIYTARLVAGDGVAQDEAQVSIEVTSQPAVVLARAFAFGATSYTTETPNATGIQYTKIVQNGAGFTYSAAQGYGYTDITTIDGSVNNRNKICDIYDEFIGVKNTSSSSAPIVFRMDVPNGKYRFVGAGGDPAYGGHQTRIVCRDGSAGDSVVLVEGVTLDIAKYWQVRFGSYTTPACAAATFVPQPESDTLVVTAGYIELLQKTTGTGGDLCLIEAWQIDAAPATNQPPVVNAGPDRSVILPSALNLTGAVTDDGLPGTGLTYAWTQTSGPSTATFSAPAALATTVIFPVAGTYVLRLTANDGELVSYDELTVTVGSEPVNTPPVVNAGADQTIPAGSSATLSGSATDDGIPGSGLTWLWSKTSGPGTVSFGNASSSTTTAGFPVEGTYVLRLTVSDGQLSSYDELTVAVTPSAGNSISIVTVGSGTTSPTGTVDVTPGAWVTISATPISTYGFVRWTAQSGVVQFEDSCKAATRVRLTTGSAQIAAVFGEKKTTVSFSSPATWCGYVSGTSDVSLSASSCVVRLTGRWEAGLGTNRSFINLSGGARVLFAHEAIINNNMVDQINARLFRPIGQGWSDTIEFESGFDADHTGWIDGIAPSLQPNWYANGISTINLQNVTYVTHSTRSLPSIHKKSGDGSYTHHGLITVTSDPLGTGARWIVRTANQSYDGGINWGFPFTIVTETDLDVTGLYAEEAHCVFGISGATGARLTKKGAGTLFLSGTQGYNSGSEMVVDEGTVQFNTNPGAPMPQAYYDAGQYPGAGYGVYLRLNVGAAGTAVMNKDTCSMQQLQSSGVVRIGGNLLRTTGTVSLTSTSTLSLDAQSRTPLQASGAVSLNGVLLIDNRATVAAGTYTLVSGSSLTGNFASAQLPAYGTLIYESTRVRLQVSPPTQVTITAQPVTNGSISPSSATVAYGGSQMFAITAYSGYLPSGTLVDNSAVPTTRYHHFTNLTANHTIGATFAPPALTFDLPGSSMLVAGPFTQTGPILFNSIVTTYTPEVHTQGLQFRNGITSIVRNTMGVGTTITSSPCVGVHGAGTVVRYGGLMHGDKDQGKMSLSLTENGRFVVDSTARLSFILSSYFTRQMWVHGDGTGTLEIDPGFVADRTAGGSVPYGIGSYRLSNARLETHHTQGLPVAVRPNSTSHSVGYNGHLVFENAPGSVWRVLSNDQDYCGALLAYVNLTVETVRDLTLSGEVTTWSDYTNYGGLTTKAENVTITKQGVGRMTVTGDQSYMAGAMLLVQEGTADMQSPTNGNLAVEVTGAGEFAAGKLTVNLVRLDIKSSTAATKVRLGGTSAGQFSTINATTAVFAGKLRVELADGYAPATGATFNVFDWGTRTGTFAALELPSGYTWDTSRLYIDGTIKVTGVN